MMGGRPWSSDDDRLLLGAHGRLPLETLAARLGRSPGAVEQRRSILRRVTAPRTYRADGPRERRVWAPEETALLRATVGLLSPEEIAERLGRTPCAVRLRAKKLRLHWVLQRGGQERHGMPAGEVARLLGLPDAKTVSWWIREGYLEGERSRVRVGPHRVWRVTPEALARFLATYRWLYRIDRIQDRAWGAFVAPLPPERYVSALEAARLLCYEPNSLSQLIVRGDLEAYKHGAHWKVPLSAIRRFVRPGDVPRPGGTVPGEVRARRAAVLAARARLEAERAARRAALRQLPASVSRRPARRSARRAA